MGEPSTPSTPWLGNLLYLVYMLPLLGFSARWTHLQLSVLAMAAALYVIWSISRKGGSPEFTADRAIMAET